MENEELSQERMIQAVPARWREDCRNIRQESLDAAMHLASLMVPQVNPSAETLLADAKKIEKYLRGEDNAN